MNCKSLLAWALVACCLVLFIAQFHWRPAPLAVSMEIRTEQAAYLRLAYYAGSGAGEKGHAFQMVDSRKGFQGVRFPIEEKRLQRFRLIQVDAARTIQLRNIRIEQWGGASVPVNIDQLKPGANIASITAVGDAIEIRSASSAFGAELTVELTPRVRETRLGGVLEWFIVGLLLCAALSLLWLLTALPARAATNALPLARDRRLGAWIIGCLIATYLLASLCGLNGSSSAAWRFFADRKDPDVTLLAGSAQHIRSDEWMVQTAWILAQHAHDPVAPLLNRVVGDGPAPLITSLPVRHWSILFRPQFLGFFFLPLEQAFAFYWNFKWFALLLGAFLFFNVVARGRSLLALGGAALVFFSGYTQWWFSSPTMMPEMIGMFFLILWSIALLMRTASRWAAAGACLVLLFAIAQFVFCCYPRFQIPLGYLAGAVLLAGLVQWSRQPAPHALPFAFRVTLLAGTLAITTALLWFWFLDLRPLLAEMRDLVYPGQRFFAGGVFPWRWFAAPFLQFGMNEHHFPEGMGNACEAAGYLFVLPLLVAVVLREARCQRFDPLLIVLTAFLTLLVLYMYYGMPLAVARWTGFAHVSSTRANIALGIGSAIALFRYLSLSGSRAAGRWAAFTLFGLLTAALCYVFHLTNLRLAEFVTFASVIAVGCFFALTFVLLWRRQTTEGCLLLIVPLIYANGLINPIDHGLPGFTESRLFQAIRETHRDDPSAKWLVLGHSGRSKMLAQFAKATGAEVIGGVRCNPDREMVEALDPTGKFREVHSRYAHISFLPGADEETRFQLTSTATYDVHLPLTPAIMDRLDVRYVLAVDLTALERAPLGYEKVWARSGVQILRAPNPAP